MRQGFLLSVFSLTAAILVSGQGSGSMQSGPAGKVVTGKAIYLPAPDYPAAMRAARLAGQVRVSVAIDSRGHVTSARAMSGHLTLWPLAEEAALRARFTPSTISGTPTPTTGVVTFTFLQTANWENIGGVMGNLELGKMVTADYGQWEKQITEDVGKQAKAELFRLVKRKADKADPIRASALTAKIIAELRRNQPVEEWYFRLGRMRSRLDEFASKPELNEEFYSELQTAEWLSLNAPTGTPRYRIAPLVHIASKYLDGKPLTKARKDEIVGMLSASYNQSQGSP